MARYLPDISTLVGFSRGYRAQREWFQSMLNTSEEVGYCQITVGECYGGAHPPERPGWSEIFDALAYWPVTRADSMQAGTWQYDFRRRGIQRALADLTIAAVAFRLDATVVTANLKDFDIPGLRVMSLPIQP
jgi:predicted nucleic acid-binding protein